MSFKFAPELIPTLSNVRLHFIPSLTQIMFVQNLFPPDFIQQWIPQQFLFHISVQISFKCWRKSSFIQSLFLPEFHSNFISVKCPPECMQTFSNDYRISFKGWRKSFSFKTYSRQISFKLNVAQILRCIHFHSKRIPAKFPSKLMSFKCLPQLMRTFSKFVQRLTQIIFIQNLFLPDFFQT